LKFLPYSSKNSTRSVPRLALGSKWPPWMPGCSWRKLTTRQTIAYEPRPPEKTSFSPRWWRNALTLTTSARAASVPTSEKRRSMVAIARRPLVMLTLMSIG